MKEFMSYLRELYLARQYIKGQQGQRKDPEAPDYIRYTWNDFCEAEGIPRQTITIWLRKFVPAEESASGQDEYTGRIPFYWKALQNYHKLTIENLQEGMEKVYAEKRSRIRRAG